ncbi:uncharacterized protein BYT42DRAFT_570187 [Radiomyces spectabilis]|uniref:uncharacterized protein n=1 Tax=Radiomyces spectabilis TaxID=64574 RepID=UPI00222026A9|nr:uncharacterized protein BYT42DRAFT_570187 [Radiomyces spectabilis]KAI8377392.1 hypothetical protein BYT42DRAFT_570187 [Radiomyces spectabilis]
MDVVVNAENAALKSDKFRIPNTKARSSMFRTLMQTGLEASQTAQSFRSSRLASDGNLVVKSNFYQTERPKSAGAQRSRSSLRNLRAAHEGSVRCATPDMGPMPVSSRSSILRDLKSLAKHRISHGPSLTRPSPPADDNSSQGSTSSDEKDRGSSKLNGCKKDKSTCKSKPETHSIRSRAQSLMSSVMGRRSQSNHAVSSAASSLRPSTNIPRSRTFMNGQRHDFKEDDSLHPCS